MSGYNESQLTLTSDENDGKPFKEDPLKSSFPQWSTRHKSLLAYVSLVLSFSTMLSFCSAIGEFGVSAFIPYIIFKICIGIPFVLLEVMLGRYVLGSAANAWCMTPISKGITYCYLIITLISSIWNNISLVYIMKYVIYSFRGNDDWDTCYGKEVCYEIGHFGSAFETCLKNNTEDYCFGLDWKSSAELFWKNRIEDTENASGLAWSFINMFIVACLILILDYKGIHTCEKTFTMMVYVPLVLSSMVAFATFLIPEATSTLPQIFTFNWVSLQDVRIWITTFEDTLLSLTLGMISLSFVSSHGDFFGNIFVDVVVVLFADIICMMLMSFPILTIAVHLKSESADFANYHTQLRTFISFSEALFMYPEPKSLWSFLFYMELTLITIGTQAIQYLAIAEVVKTLLDTTFSQFYISCFLGLLTFILGSPFLFLKFHFNPPIQIAMVIVLFLCNITLIGFYGIGRVSDDFQFMMGYPVPVFIKFTWISGWIFPLVFLIIRMTDDYVDFKSPSKTLVYGSLATACAVYVSSAAFEALKAHKEGRALNVFSPNPNWGPNNQLLMKSRVTFNARAATKEFMYRQQLYKKSYIQPVDFSNQSIVQLS